jgi:molybdopterin-guanine dinucleotide biosynthesis protein A
MSELSPNGTHPSFAAIVLAGGRSQRMGTNKACIEVDGRTILESVVTRVATRCRPIVVVADADTRARAEALALPVSFVEDPPVYRREGPLAGVYAGLMALDASRDWVHLSACDNLLWSAANFDALAAVCQRSGVVGAWWMDAAGRGNPLHGIVLRDWARQRALALLAAGERRLSALFQGREHGDASIVELSLRLAPAPQAFEPCNTPDDLARIVQRLAADATPQR